MRGNEGDQLVKIQNKINVLEFLLKQVLNNISTLKEKFTKEEKLLMIDLRLHSTQGPPPPLQHGVGKHKAAKSNEISEILFR